MARRASTAPVVSFVGPCTQLSTRHSRRYLRRLHTDHGLLESPSLPPLFSLPPAISSGDVLEVVFEELRHKRYGEV